MYPLPAVPWLHADSAWPRLKHTLPAHPSTGRLAYNTMRLARPRAQRKGEREKDIFEPSGWLNRAPKSPASFDPRAHGAARSSYADTILCSLACVCVTVVECVHTSRFDHETKKKEFVVLARLPFASLSTSARALSTRTQKWIRHGRSS